MKFFSTAAASFSMVTAASAVSFLVPTNVHPGDTINVFWTSGSNDPATWTLALFNGSDIWGYKGTLADNVDNTLGQITVTLPTPLPTYDNYVLTARKVDNFDWVVGYSPKFTITN